MKEKTCILLHFKWSISIELFRTFSHFWAKYLNRESKYRLIPIVWLIEKKTAAAIYWLIKVELFWSLCWMITCLINVCNLKEEQPFFCAGYIYFLLSYFDLFCSLFCFYLHSLHPFWRLFCCCPAFLSPHLVHSCVSFY